MTTPEPTSELGRVAYLQATSERLYHANFLGRSYLATYVAEVQNLCDDNARLRAQVAAQGEVVKAARIVVTCCDVGDCGGECLDDLTNALTGLDAATAPNTHAQPAQAHSGLEVVHPGLETSGGAEA